MLNVRAACCLNLYARERSRPGVRPRAKVDFMFPPQRWYAASALERGFLYTCGSAGGRQGLVFTTESMHRHARRGRTSTNNTIWRSCSVTTLRSFRAAGHQDGGGCQEDLMRSGEYEESLSVLNKEMTKKTRKNVSLSQA